MKQNVLLLAGAMAIAMSGQAWAQAGTCLDPIPITSGDVFDLSTCAYPNTLGTYGSTTSAQREAIFSYVSNAANAAIEVSATGAGTGAWAPGIFLSPSCDVGTNAIALGFPGTPMVVNSTNSPDGATMYIYVTSDPGGAAEDCGPFHLEVDDGDNADGAVDGILPVDLQSMSVE